MDDKESRRKINGGSKLRITMCFDVFLIGLFIVKDLSEKGENKRQVEMLNER